jgi:predicted transcriptional regulator
MNSNDLKDFIEHLIITKSIDSVKDFSEKSDISRQYIYKMIDGDNKISLKTIAKIKSTFTEEYINFKAIQEKKLLEETISNSIVSEEASTYNQCESCRNKSLIIKQQNATIEALQETLALYRKTEQQNTNTEKQEP